MASEEFSACNRAAFKGIASQQFSACNRTVFKGIASQVFSACNKGTYKEIASQQMELYFRRFVSKREPFESVNLQLV
jgi:hypothetical protein